VTAWWTSKDSASFQILNLRDLELGGIAVSIDAAAISRKCVSAMIDRPEVHFKNPWPEAIPVPVQELVACCAGGTVSTPNGVRSNDEAYLLERWRQFGEKLDGYLLIASSQDPTTLRVGVRYGPAGEQYLSPHCQNRQVAMDLLQKYGPQANVDTPSPRP
jgi:hypothetical protein